MDDSGFDQGVILEVLQPENTKNLRDELFDVFAGHVLENELLVVQNILHYLLLLVRGLQEILVEEVEIEILEHVAPHAFVDHLLLLERLSVRRFEGGKKKMLVSPIHPHSQKILLYYGRKLEEFHQYGDRIDLPVQGRRVGRVLANSSDNFRLVHVVVELVLRNQAVNSR